MKSLEEIRKFIKNQKRAGAKMQLKFYLEDNLGMEVDLVIASTLKERLKPYIMKEVLYV